MSKKSLIKIIISVLMLALVLYSVDFNELRHNLHSVPITTAIIFVLGYAFSQILSALRWWIVTRGAGIESRFSTAVSAAFVGMYINVFGLGTLGGDVARAMLITNDSRKRQTSLATVIADRSFGLAVLALIGVSASAFFYSQKLSSGLLTVAGGLVVLVAVGWFAGPWLVRRFLGESRAGELIARLVQGFPASPRVLLPMLVVATIFHLMQIALFGYLAHGMGVSIPLSYLLVTIPFANILTTLPLSWMGLGVRENVYVFFFVPEFLTHEQAVVCGALWLVAMTATSAVGGVIAVASGSLKVINAKSS